MQKKDHLGGVEVWEATGLGNDMDFDPEGGRGVLLFEPPQRVLCFWERVLNQFREKE